jgi:hypothetical protein
VGNIRAVQLDELEGLKHAYGPGCAQKCERHLRALRGASFDEASSLIRFHDALLFLRAFPQSEKVAQLAHELLATVEAHVKKLLNSPENVEIFEDESASGIAGTTITNTWTYQLAAQLASRHPQQTRAEWNIDERYRQMTTILPALLPLLDDDSYVEADTPYLRWIEAAAGRGKSDLCWLVDSFAKLPLPPQTRTSLYDSLGVEILWDLSGSPASRTLACRPVSKLFIHEEPLLQRKQVSLEREVLSEPLPLQKLNRKEGQAIIGMVQDAVAVRYRELQGTTYGDPTQMVQTEVGRGLKLFFWGLDPQWRLPLRAYYAGFALKNGVPINYFEAIGLFEWMEVGFNTFYAFREGETAWIYSQYLRLLHQISGATCISVYPYQIGQDNQEAINSGAFWFYRKLGFRPGRPELLELAKREESKIARDSNHRTSPRTLRKLAEGHIFFEFGTAQPGRWDKFSSRNLGLAVQRKMADEFDGDAGKMRRTSSKNLAKLLDVSLDDWNPRERWAFDNFAIALSVVPNIARWTQAEKQSLLAIIRAKAAPSETRYLRLLQQHARLRDAFVQAGSSPRTADQDD